MTALQITLQTQLQRARVSIATCERGAPMTDAIGADDISSILADAVTAARAAWPAIQLPTELFTAYVMDRLPGDAEREAALRRLRAADLYLACACVHGDQHALDAFDAHCLTAVDRALSRIGIDADTVSEVKQRLRRMLLVAEAGQPRISGFTGRGDLRRWVRVMALHEAFALRRKAQRDVVPDDNDLQDRIAVGSSTELDYFKRVYQSEFEAAFRDAVRALPDRDRTLVRQHYLDGVTIEQLARLYRVHRVTAGRWLEGARTSLLKMTRDLMVKRLGVSTHELESVLRLVFSRLDLHLSSWFRTKA